MTANVIKVLEKIQDSTLFKGELYFVGGTALSYYLHHRVSEDIDIVSAKKLEYKTIIPEMLLLGATKLQDANVTALRMAGLMPDEYMLKFILDDVKIEFFQANRSIQQEILKEAHFSAYQNSTLKILDVKSISKLKLVALLQREKSRDLFDLGAILEQKVLCLETLLEISTKIDNITTLNDFIEYIKSKKEPCEDESVYLSQEKRIDLTFEAIKKEVIELLLTSEGTL